MFSIQFKACSTLGGKALNNSGVHLNKLFTACFSSKASRFTTNQVPANVVKATIVKVKEPTPSIKTVSIQLDDAHKSNFHFKAGQWANLYIPGHGKHGGDKYVYGGFSICSSPLAVQKTGLVEFAVKKTQQPAAEFLTTHSKPSDEVLIEGGRGEFFYDSDSHNRPLVLIGGGIGITPLISIMSHVNNTNPDLNVTLIHSVRTTQDLAIFHDLITKLKNSNRNFNFIATVTSEEQVDTKSAYPYSIKQGRINLHTFQAPELEEARKHIHHHHPNTHHGGHHEHHRHEHKHQPLFYVCGPLQMVHSVSEIIKELGVTDHNILVEKWDQ